MARNGAFRALQERRGPLAQPYVIINDLPKPEGS
jgi:hypothetical protein